MRQISLGINQSCPNCPRFQITPYFYITYIPAHQKFLEERYFLAVLRIWIWIPYVFGLPNPDPFVRVTDPDPFYHQAKIVRKTQCPHPVVEWMVDSVLSNTESSPLWSKIQAISYLSVTTPSLSWTVDSVLSNTKSSFLRSKIQGISHLSVTTPFLSWTVDSVLSNTESSPPRSKSKQLLTYL